MSVTLWKHHRFWIECSDVMDSRRIGDRSSEHPSAIATLFGSAGYRRGSDLGDDLINQRGHISTSAQPLSPIMCHGAAR